MTNYEKNLIASDAEPLPSSAVELKPVSSRPQRLHTWFNLIPVQEYEQQRPEQVLFLDTFVTIQPCSESEMGYKVLFEGQQPMVVVVKVGIIFVWYGEDLVQPDRPFPEFQQEYFPTRYISSQPTIFENTHVMDFVENGSDNLHFKIVHLWNHSKLYDHEVTKDNITLKQDTRFNYGSCSTNPFIRLMSKVIPELELTHDYVYHGPGLAVVGAEGRGAPDFHALVSLTPEGPNRTRVYVTMALSPDTFPKFVEKAFQKLFPQRHLCDLLTGVMANYIKNEFDIDAIIWKNRKWLKNPQLIASEKHLYDVIRWGESYYPKDYQYPEEQKKTAEQKLWLYMDDVKSISDGNLHTYELNGESLIAYVDSNQQVQVFDAFCPHQGAHLGHGGILQDDCVRCPFHGFNFTTEGKCIGQNTKNINRTLPNLDLKAIPFRIFAGRIEVNV